MPQTMERAIPVDAGVTAIVRGQRPDVLLVTPLVEFGSDQIEYVKAARRLGIPTGLCVHSWDNLTTKGLIRVLPDRIFVWNEAQRREAVSLHDAAPDQVIVTGAPVYDQWFDRRPSRSRADFCARVGLPETGRFSCICVRLRSLRPTRSLFSRDGWRRCARPRIRTCAARVF